MYLSVSSVVALATLSALTPLASATCYGTGLQLGELRGPFSRDADVIAVEQAIHKVCSKANGTTYRKGTESWKSCVNVPMRFEKDAEDCQSCQKECMEGLIYGKKPIGQNCAMFCGTKARCTPDPNNFIYMPMNRLEFEIRHDHPNYEEYMADYGACVAAFRTEVGGCARGGAQTHEGFWYRIDPEQGACEGHAGEILA